VYLFLDDDLLFDGEWPRVVRDTKEGNVRQVTHTQFADWERQQVEGNLLCRLRRIVFDKGDKNLTETTAEGHTKLMVTDGYLKS
jgi:hypothetical protein